jgi:hypothetical protein
VSDSGVRRILHDADLKPHRQKMWLTAYSGRLGHPFR